MIPRRIIILAALLAIAALPAAAQEHDCVVRQFIMTNNVVKLEPQGKVEGDYPVGTERAYAYARLDCSQVPQGGETFWFHWVYDGKEVARSRARVDVSRNWRIWSHSRVFPGRWAVLLKDSAGRLQAEQRFAIQGSEQHAGEAD